MKKLLVLGAHALLATFGLVTVLTAPLSAAQTEPRQRETQERIVSFAVDRMTCATCPITVRAAMYRVAGVRSVRVDFASKRATVVYDPARTTPQAIAQASTSVGFPAHAVNETPAHS